MAKKTPKYVKIITGMNCCYGGLDERDCASCPYDKYNDAGFYGEGGAECMLRLNADAKKLTESLDFCFCKDCMCYRPETDPATWKPADHGHCSIWNCDVLETEYCSRGGIRE